jgi:hypothetical protein
MDDKGVPREGAFPAADAAREGVSSFPPTIRRRLALTLDETEPLWNHFRAGGAPRCPVDHGPIALSVDGGDAYRLVCTQCGTASSWFDVIGTSLRDRLTDAPGQREPA